MDKNTIIGIVLILGILFTFNFLNKETAEQQLAREQVEAKYNDSIQELKNVEQLAENVEEVEVITVSDSASPNFGMIDSLAQSKLTKQFGIFASASQGAANYYTIENDLLKLTLSSKGGKVVKAELKKYQSYPNYMIARDSLKDIAAKDLPILEPLQLFDEDSSTMFFDIAMNSSKNLKTSDLYFTPIKTESNNIVLRAKTSEEGKYIEMSYKLEDNYDVDFNLTFAGLEDEVEGKIDLNWEMKSLITEKEAEGQSRMSSVFYKPSDDGRTYLSELTEAEEELESKTDWVAFKHCYFSSMVMSENGFEKGGNVYSNPIKTAKYSDEYKAVINVSTEIDDKTKVPLKFFFGPNEYEVLKAHDNESEDIIDLGWGVFRWTAKWLIMPIFNFLNGLGIAMGIIILLVTITVRLIILPLTYKNYKSSAKMKVLKPEIEEINAKFKDGDAAKKQQATMALYRQTGVNPMAGCLPLFIQMPILLAVFRFFPSSLELRQRSFLWAEDLSTYESVMDLGFNIPFYGDHVSLFTLLLCISTIFYTRMNSSQMSMPSNPGMPNMKIIMYMMPLMMLFFLNNYAAGLTFYYFCGNLITMGLMIFVKKYLISEDKIRATIDSNKLKPKKQSAFQQRMQEAMKQQQAQKKGKK
ncbi:membrane protein insertase YidC [bacterium]|nr:membrane protein insertase YidC [bacterium]MDB9701969.1 membrane protein insertase YidC [Flavobacteriales bacterium]